MTEPEATSAPLVREARLIGYRLFDLGDEILLDEALERLTRLAPELSPTRKSARGLPHEPPVDLTLPDAGPCDPCLPGGLLTSARLFSQGMVSVRFEALAPASASLDELRPGFLRLTDPAFGEGEARTIVERLRALLGPALVPGASLPWGGLQSYGVVFIEGFEGVVDAERALTLHAPAICELLSAEVDGLRLSSREVSELTQHALSYQQGDLVLPHWEGALVVEPSGSRELLDVLELACAVLTGLRACDAQLEAELDPMFELARRRTGLLGLLWNPLHRHVHGVHRRWLELTEFTERWENAIKVVGDHYNARVYRAALERLGIPSWQRAVERKQARIEKVYTFLKAELDNQRMLLAELAIVLLIVTEIALYLLGDG